VFVGLGERPSHWRPATDGVGFELSPIMKSLEPYREHLTVVSELCTPINGHAPTAAAWSTGVLAKATIAEDVLLGPSIDQIVARQIGGETVFPSIEVCTEDVTGYLGGCDPAYACAYINTTSWANATTPLPMEINPRTLFERLFGRAGTAAQRLAAQQTDRSILDSLRDDVRELQSGLGQRDQSRLGEYLDNVREIEQRIQRTEARNSSSTELSLDAPIGVPESYQEHTHLLFDLMAVAWQADLTRVASFMMAREASMKTYPEIGITEPHHTISHHREKPDVKMMHASLNAYHMSLFAKFIAKLKATPDGDGTLLDHSMVFYGSGMSNANVHGPYPLPLVAVGGWQGKGYRHIVTPEHTPLGNLWVGVGDMFGIPEHHFGESTGRVNLT
jgi:hypothetical protein